MITLKDETETSLVVKKSRFLGLACRVDSEQQAQALWQQRKKQHYDAAHHCFAYLLETGRMQYSDDGEPQGTAGLPMLEVIKKTGLSDVLVICTRYFGGTLLGSGGLVRAYTESASQTLSAAKKIRLIPCSLYECTFAYTVWAKAERALADAGYPLDRIDYSDEVTAQVCVADGEETCFFDHVTSLSLGKTVPHLIGHKHIKQDLFPG